MFEGFKEKHRHLINYNYLETTTDISLQKCLLVNRSHIIRLLLSALMIFLELFCNISKCQALIWSTPEIISTDDSIISMYRGFAVDGSGNWYISYNHQNPNTNNVGVAYISNSGNPSIPNIIAESSSCEYMNSDIAVDSGGRLHAVFIGWEPTLALMYANNVHGYWSTPEIISTDDSIISMYRGFAVDGSGNWYISYNHQNPNTNNVGVAYISNSGNPSIPNIIAESSSCEYMNSDIAVDSGGGLHAVFIGWEPTLALMYANTVQSNPPVASFTYYPEIPTVGGNIEFNASGSKPEGKIGSYKWDWGDGQSEYISTPKNTHEYASPGIYTITLTVTDDMGMTGSTFEELDLTLKGGDILLCRDDISFVPGKEWTHAGMYIGNGQVIEALRDVGVVISPISEWSFTGHEGKCKTYVKALRVKTDDFTREKAVNFALGKQTQSFDLPKIILQSLGWMDKHVESDSWYCSELIWAAYQYASDGAIDIDQSLNANAVSPDEIDGSSEVEMIGEHKEAKPETVWCWDRLWGGIAYCPVDLVITAPDGLILNKQGSEIAEGIYQELDIDGDNELDDFFAIPEPKEGIYLVEVVPEAGASPTETFTLAIYRNGATKVLVEDIQVQDIPDFPFVVTTLASISGDMEIEPETLNLGSKGNWITCYIQFPEAYYIANIDSGTILLNGEIPPARLFAGDEDDIERILMVKFDRSDLQKIVQPGNVELIVTGELLDGTPFECIDTIRVIDKSPGKTRKLEN